MSGLTPDTYLSATEVEAIELTRKLANLCGEIVGDGPTRTHDMAELVGKIHDIQHAIMSQAASRLHPEMFRLLGGTIEILDPRTVLGAALQRQAERRAEAIKTPIAHAIDRDNARRFLGSLRVDNSAALAADTIRAMLPLFHDSRGKWLAEQFCALADSLATIAIEP